MEILKIEDKDKNISWMPYEEYIRRKEWMDAWERDYIKHVIWGIPYPPKTTEEIVESRIKLAWVLINNQRVMIGVDNVTLKGYELGEWYSIIKPLKPKSYDGFERWCTSFDV